MTHLTENYRITMQQNRPTWFTCLTLTLISVIIKTIFALTFNYDVDNPVPNVKGEKGCRYNLIRKCK